MIGSRKLLFILSFIICFIIISGSAYGWADSNYQYRKPITIDRGGASNLTGFQVNVTVDTASLISAGKMKADCSDVRFYSGDDTTKLAYYLESGCNTTATQFWVKDENNAISLYMYYDNPTASSESNPAGVYDFYDNFTGETTLNSSIWDTSSSTYSSVEDNSLYLQAGGTVYSLHSFPSSDIIEMHFSIIALPSGGWGAFWFGFSDIGVKKLWIYDTRMWRFNYDSAGDYSEGLGTYPSAVGNFTVISYDTPTSMNLKLGGDLSDSVTYGGTVQTGDSRLGLNGGYNGKDSIQSIKLRKYADPFPTVTLGSETSNNHLYIKAITPTANYISQKQNVNFTAYLEGSNLTRLTLHINDTGQSWNNQTALMNASNYTFPMEYLPLGNHSWDFQLCTNISGIESCITTPYRNITITGGNILVYLYDEDSLQLTQGNVTIRVLNTQFEHITNTTAVNGIGSLTIPSGNYIIIAGGGQNDSYIYPRRKRISVHGTTLVKMYLPKQNVVNIIFQLTDYSGLFPPGSIINIQSMILGALTTIDARSTDIASKASFYLEKGKAYYISVSSAQATKTLGYFFPEYSTTRTLVMSSIEYTPKTFVAYADVHWNVLTNISQSPATCKGCLPVTTGTIRIDYNDTSGKTTSVQVWIYNGTNTSDILYTGKSYTSLATWTYILSNINKTYEVKIEAENSIYGKISAVTMASFGIGRVSIHMKQWQKEIIAIAVILLTAFIFTARYAYIGAFVVVGEMVMFNYWEWTSYSKMVISLAVLLIILARWKDE